MDTYAPLAGPSTYSTAMSRPIIDAELWAESPPNDSPYLSAPSPQGPSPSPSSRPTATGRPYREHRYTSDAAPLSPSTPLPLPSLSKSRPSSTHLPISCSISGHITQIATTRCFDGDAYRGQIYRPTCIPPCPSLGLRLYHDIPSESKFCPGFADAVYELAAARVKSSKEERGEREG